MYPNVIECINQRVKILRKYATKEIILNNKLFNGIVNKKYLDISKKEYDKVKSKIEKIINKLYVFGHESFSIKKISML